MRGLKIERKNTIGQELFLQSLETRSPLLLGPLFATHARARPRPMVGLLWFPRVAPQHLHRLHPPRLCTLLSRLLPQSLYHQLSLHCPLTLQREDMDSIEVLCCRVDAPSFQSCGLHVPSTRRRARSRTAPRSCRWSAWRSSRCCGSWCCRCPARAAWKGCSTESPGRSAGHGAAGGRRLR